MKLRLLTSVNLQAGISMALDSVGGRNDLCLGVCSLELVWGSNISVAAH